MYSVSDETRKPIFEGVQGENESREIQFDISSWIEELGEGACTATAKRPTDTTPYPVTVTRSGNVVKWKPNSTDTSIEGIGAFQLAFSINDVVAKTRIWNTKIAPSLVGAGDPPDPYDDWLAEMRSIEANAIQAAEDAEDSADAAAASAANLEDTIVLVDDINTLLTGNVRIDDTHFLYRKSLSGSSVVDSNNTILVYSININAGDTIGLSNYSNYRFYVKELVNGSWDDYISAWQYADLTINESVTISVYVRKLDNSNVDTTDYEEIKELFFLKTATSIIEQIEATEDIVFGTDFENRFDSNNLLSLPSGFGAFPITIELSRYKNVYGHSLSPMQLVKNNSSGATYFMSPNGDDTNDGKTRNTPLKTIATALGKSDINTLILLSGYYYNGVHFSNQSPITKVINLIGEGEVNFKSNPTQVPLKIQEGCYIENIIFDGGTSACVTELSTQKVVFNKCVFKNSGSLNGLTAQGGYYVLFNCIADNNMLDGFNYHSYSAGAYMPFAIEIGCKGKLNGDRSNQTINNGSTMHEYGKIIRIGCEYSSCRGGTVAEADGAKSVNICVKASSTEAIDTENRNGNFVAINNSAMWLYDCSSFGSPYDVISDNSAVHSTVTYTKESAVNSGTIDRMS